ncbi:MAG: cell surface protein SprA, partial [Bacteroidetes bacterium]|nr:cell surface protein SprA [Bacteroidota bacterium]
DKDAYQSYKDTVIDNILNLGRPTSYLHNYNVNYNVPLNKIGLLNWINANTRYSGNYRWTAAPLSAATLGNTIENSRTLQINGQFNFSTLYNKWGFLRKYNSPTQKKKPAPKPKGGSNDDDSDGGDQEMKTVTFTKEGVSFKAGKAKTITHKLGTEDKITVTLTGEDGKVIPANIDVIDANKVEVITDSSHSKVKVVVTGQKPKGINIPEIVFRAFMNLILGVKNVSFSYTNTNGTLLPGYKPETYIMGMDNKWKYPGWGFVFGEQKDIRPYLIENQAISDDTLLNSAYVTTFTENFSARSTIEPFKGFKIELTATRTYSENFSEYYRAGADGSFESYSPTKTGNFSISYLTWNTAFIQDDKNTHISEIFENFSQNRYDIAIRLANRNPNWNGTFSDSTGYPDGYGPTSQEVVIPAFLAAYSGKDGKSSALNLFPEIPMPNWRVTYDGLSKLKLFKKYFKSFSVGHGYRSTYNVGSYLSNVNFNDPDEDGFTLVRETLGEMNFVPQYEIGQITVSEQFSPLLNINATWHNSLLTKLEIKKTRNLSLSLTNTQLTEVWSNEIVIGLGYRIKDVQFMIKSGGKIKPIKSDLNLLTNISIRTNKTVLRKLVEDVNQISSGQRIITINTSADYMINQRFSIRLFFDKIITNPFVSSQFPNSNTNAGISLRFTLAQ